MYHNYTGINSAGIKYLLIFFLLFLWLCDCHAAEITLSPSISGGIRYDDNISFSRIARENDLVFMLSPGIGISSKTDTVTFKTGIKGNLFRYRDHDDLDQDHYDLDLGIAGNLSERSSLNGNASRSRDSTLDSELSGTGILTQSSYVDRDNLGLGFSYLLSERSRITLNSSWFRADYKSDRYTDYDGFSVSAAFSRAMDSGKNTLFLQPYYSENSSAYSSVKNMGLYTGWSRNFSETLSLSASIGARRTETEYYYLRGKDWGWVADISFEKKGETWKADLGLSSDTKLSSYGDPVETYKLKTGFSKKFTERISYAFSGAVTSSESTGYYSLRDTVYYNVDNSLSYWIRKNIYLRLSYTYSVSHDSLRETEKSIDRNRLAVTLSYSFQEKL